MRSRLTRISTTAKTQVRGDEKRVTRWILIQIKVASLAGMARVRPKVPMRLLGKGLLAAEVLRALQDRTIKIS